MKSIKIFKKSYKWFLSFIVFSLAGSVVLAACSTSTNTSSATSENNNQGGQASSNSEGAKDSTKLLEKQTFKKYLSSFPVTLEEAFQIPKNTLESEKISAGSSNPDFKYVFQEFFEANEAVVGSLAGTDSSASGMYQTIGTNTDNQSQQTIFGYLAALSQNSSTRSKRSTEQNLFEKIKTQLSSLVNSLAPLKTVIEAGKKKTTSSNTPDYLKKQTAVLVAAQELVKNPNNTNWSTLKNNVGALESLVNPALTELTKVTGNINQLKNDFSELSKSLGANNATEISANTNLNNLLNKFSELFLTQRAASASGHAINLPFDPQASLFESKAAVKLVEELDTQVNFANLFTKVHENDPVTINLFESHYNDNVSQDLRSLKEDKAKNLLIVLRENTDTKFLKNLKILRTSLNSYKVLLGDETQTKSVSFALKQALVAIDNDTAVENNNKDNAEAALKNLTENLQKFKTEFASLQTDLERFTTSLEELETKTEKIMADLDQAENFSDLLNVISQSVTLKNQILEINNLVPLPNEDNASNPVSSFDLGAKIDTLRALGTLKQLDDQSEKVWKFIQKMPSETSTATEALKAALEKVTNETSLNDVRVQIGALDQLLYGSPDWNGTKTPTYALNGYQGQKMQNYLTTPTNLKDFLSNFGTSNRDGITTLGKLVKLINENYTLEANSQASAILNKITEAIK